MPTLPQQNYSAPEGEVHPKDCFQTPAYAIDPLVPYLRSAGIRRIWESAAGEGNLVNALKRSGFTVWGTDLNRGYDYFKTTPTLLWQAQVTNPPFSQKYKWLQRACELDKPFALLMPSSMLFSGKYAQPLIRQYGIEVLVPDKRVNFKTPNKGWNGSAAQFHSSWFTRGLNVGQLITWVQLHPRSEDEWTPTTSETDCALIAA